MLDAGRESQPAQGAGQPEDRSPKCWSRSGPQEHASQGRERVETTNFRIKSACHPPLLQGDVMEELNMEEQKALRTAFDALPLEEKKIILKYSDDRRAGGPCVGS